MKRLIITEEEKRNILLKHGSKSLINEASNSDVVAIQTKLGITADGVAGPKTVNAILTKLGGSSTPEATTTTPTTASTTPTTASTTPVASTTTPTTPVAPTTPTAGTTFSAVPVAGATTEETACGDKKTNKNYRLCKKVFRTNNKGK
jgi:hypothetical protein